MSVYQGENPWQAIMGVMAGAPKHVQQVLDFSVWVTDLIHPSYPMRIHTCEGVICVRRHVITS